MALDTDEACFAPVRTPTILHQPVLHSMLFTVTDEQDVVVHDHVVLIASVKDATFVEIPMLRCVHSHSDRADPCHRLHQSKHIIFLHLFPAPDTCNGLHTMAQL